jgi:hypothetical protein
MRSMPVPVIVFELKFSNKFRCRKRQCPCLFDILPSVTVINT